MVCSTEKPTVHWELSMCHTCCCSMLWTHFGVWRLQYAARGLKTLWVSMLDFLEMGAALMLMWKPSLCVSVALLGLLPRLHLQSVWLSRWAQTWRVIIEVPVSGLAPRSRRRKVIQSQNETPRERTPTLSGPDTALQTLWDWRSVRG